MASYIGMLNATAPRPRTVLGVQLGLTNTSILGLATTGLALAIHLAHKYRVKRHAKRNALPSRLMGLPSELRNEIYAYVLEPDPSQQPTTLAVTTIAWCARFAWWCARFLEFLSWLTHRSPIRIPLLKHNVTQQFTTLAVGWWYVRLLKFSTWLISHSPIRIILLAPVRNRSTPTSEHLNVMTRVNKQFKTEFLDVYSRMATFNFTLDASDITHDKPFNISMETLGRMRKCVLRILATPGIVGAFDPREATGDWSLRDKVFEAMSQMTSLQDMVLSINACGNQLWNPLWLWHFTSQAFKESPIKAFRRIEFKLEGWTLREPNHLARNSKGEWEWHCSEGHRVRVDGEGAQPVREFCAALYDECRTCDPLPDGESEGA